MRPALASRMHHKERVCGVCKYSNEINNNGPRVWAMLYHTKKSERVERIERASERVNEERPCARAEAPTAKQQTAISTTNKQRKTDRQTDRQKKRERRCVERAMMRMVGYGK